MTEGTDLNEQLRRGAETARRAHNPEVAGLSPAAATKRGYAAIGLDRPKCTANLGGVLRAAGVYRASVVMLSGGRMGKYATDTMRAYRHLPCLEVDDLLAHVPYGATAVAVEICGRAKRLFSFVHPQSAFYIFGPEDGGVHEEILARVPVVVSVPTNGCMNLAATVNVVLYDRLCKQERN